MSNTYFDATGVLLFDGPARITPVIEMLFKPFNLGTQRADGPNQRYLNLLSEDSTPDWESYLDSLIASQPEAQRQALSLLESPASILSEIGLHLDVDLESFIATIDFDGQVDILDIVLLAKLFQDGHNLIGLSMEGGWHCDRALLWEFGGWAVHSTPRCTVDVSSSNVRRFAESLDEAIATSPDSTANVLNQWLNRFIDGIHDPSLQESLRFRYVLPDTTDSTSSVVAASWSRMLYVRASCTDNGAGPKWARIEVTPDLIHRIKMLRAACNMHSVSDIRAVGSPDAWGPGIDPSNLPLIAPRLVVTPDSFWFFAQPAGRIAEFETLPLSVHWLIDTFTAAGEPVYRRVTPETVNGHGVR
jgi:hypothetical protein